MIMRAFIALELQEGFANEVYDLAQQLRMQTNGRFMKPESYHLTLAFLGDIGEAQATDAIGAIEEACASRCAIELLCTGLGNFGRKHDATLWLGLEKTEQLMNLAESIRSELAARALSFDAKKFLPHITLARHADLSSGSFDGLFFPRPDIATHVTLFKSTLTPEGAHYKPLHVCELAAE